MDSHAEGPDALYILFNFRTMLHLKIILSKYKSLVALVSTTIIPGADLGGGCRGCAPPSP